MCEDKCKCQECNWIVGKSYVNVSRKITIKVHKVISVADNGDAWSEFSVNNNITHCTWFKANRKNFKEYKEPVVHTRYVHWYKMKGETYTETSRSKEYPSWINESKYIKTDIVTYTEEF